MFCTSLHGIKITASGGLYEQEQLIENQFEIDVDIFQKADVNGSLPFIDYAEIYNIVAEVFKNKITSLEKLLQELVLRLKNKFSEMEKIKLVVKKLNPPLSGQVSAAQLSFEG